MGRIRKRLYFFLNSYLSFASTKEVRQFESKPTVRRPARFETFIYDRRRISRPLLELGR